MLLEPAEYTDGGRILQRGLLSIMERRFREIKENVHDEVEEELTTAIERFLSAVEVWEQANLTENMCLVQTMARACAH